MNDMMTPFEAEVQCAILQAIESQANRTAAALERVVALQERILCNKEYAARAGERSSCGVPKQYPDRARTCFRCTGYKPTIFTRIVNALRDWAFSE